MRLLRILDHTGDTRISYELDDPAKLADARAAFDAAVAKGHSVFNVTPGSNDLAKRVTNFNDLSEEAIAVPVITAG